jgi:L-cysteine S-thiosulfotransferase
MRVTPTRLRTAGFGCFVRVRRYALTGITATFLGACASGAPPHASIVGDGISAPLAGLMGDATRGRALVAARDPANCVLCHALPGQGVAGDVGPSLAAIGARMSIAQIRLRVVDQERVNPTTIMPSYYRVEGLVDVAPEYRGKTILSAQAVEDIVAYLATLQ